MTKKVIKSTKKRPIKIHHKHFFTAGMLSFFLTGAILGLFFWSQMSNRNNFANALHVYKPGQVIGNAYYEVRIDNISRSNGEVGSMKPTKDKEYLLVDVYIKNKSGKTLEFFPISQTYIKDAKGQTYSIGAAMVSQPLQAGDIVSGDHIKGQIAYQVPKNIENPRFYLEGLASTPLVIQLK